MNLLLRLLQAFQCFLIDHGQTPSDRRSNHFLSAIGCHSRAHLHGHTLYEHLCGTREILSKWKQPEWILYAGLFHAVYQDQVLQPRDVHYDYRRALRGVIGTKAERLVYLNAQFTDFDLSEVIDAYKGGVHKQFKNSTEIDMQCIFSILIIRLASRMEDAAPWGAPPSEWISSIFGYVSQLEVFSTEPFPFSRDLVKLSEEDERLLISDYEAGLRSFEKDLPTAAHYFLNCASKCPFLAELWIWLSFIAALQGDTASANELAGKAIEVSDRWPIIWDRRLHPEEWLLTARCLATMKDWNAQPSRSISKILRNVCDHSNHWLIEPAETALVLSELDRSDCIRLLSYFALPALDPEELMVNRYPSLGHNNAHQNLGFLIAERLEGSIDAIRSEVSSLPNGAFLNSYRIAKGKGREDRFPFYRSGHRYPTAFSFCPALGRIIDSSSEVMRSGLGYIEVVKMFPRTYLAPHKEISNVFLLVVVPIVLADGDAGIDFESATVTFEMGKAVVFDPTAMHEEWNDSDQECIYIALSVWHPVISRMERQVIEAVSRTVDRQAERISRERSMDDFYIH